MSTKKILVIDDELDLCDILLFNLRNAGFTAEAAYSAEEAEKRGVNNYDLLLLDVMMPGISGYDFAYRLKSNPLTSSIPIIFLTAKDTEEDTLRGFGLGADDYIKKPFSVREVIARIRAVLDRAGNLPSAPADQGSEKDSEHYITYKGICIDHTQKTVTVDGGEVSLTRTEYELLRHLILHRGEVLSRQQLIELVWRPNVIVSDRAVDVNIARLRKKIGIYAEKIISKAGFGYLFKN